MSRGALGDAGLGHAALSAVASTQDALGHFRELSHQGRLIGAVVLGGMVCLASLLERLQYQLRATEQSVWWASNGRDVVNAFALGVMALGLSVYGFGGPIALCVAATFVVLLSTVQASVERHHLATVWSLAAGLALGFPLLGWPRAMFHAFHRAIVFLFG